MVDNQKQGGEELHREPEKPRSDIARREEEVLALWEREHIFEKTLKKKAPKGEYVFYDGPPFATGLPHYGHILQSAIKDAVPRYRTMRGYRVARQWGWDCHGLPLENQIEQELGFKTKRDIEEYGVEKFNRAARDTVLRYASDWRRFIPRIGRWADMEHDYKTMDASYTESVWWAFKHLYNKHLVYEGFKAMHLCPRCGTTLSNFEVALGYQDIKDVAVTVRLPLIEEPGTSLLVWTTTPWTLPGNVAAAVNKDATYVKVRTDEGFVVVAKDLAHKILGENPKIYGEIQGEDLVGKSYEPPFPYFKNLVHKHKSHAWKVYAAPYVTLEDGTGIVHLAPAYGAEDMELAQKEKIPLIHHVTDDGRFISTVTDFAHMPVKPKGRHMETDEKVAEYLEKSGRLFKKEIITHSYPHCWRCDTPLLNWSANSWFVNVQKVKRSLVGQNKKVRWVPEHVGNGRFNNLLQGAPDWAISRSRYWGAPIPVWRHSKSKEVRVIGSVAELLSMVRRSGNRYFLMRHGEAQSNVDGFLNSDNTKKNHVTEKGLAAARVAAANLKGKKIDMIVASPLLRAQETAAQVCKELGLPASAIMTDERLAEVQFGKLNGEKVSEWRAFFATLSDAFNHTIEGAENYTTIYRRVGEFLFDVERRYSGKNILIVTHGVPAWLMSEVAARTPRAVLHTNTDAVYLEPAQWKEISFVPFPHDENFELDLHRPYIDEVPLGDALRGEWKRVPDVFDCWFESGSMPFASHHYPFKTSVFNPKRFFGLMPKGYPAHFIAEGVDQTRGWFYSLIVLGTALFGKAPYKAVITNGLILAEDGRKMSKKLKNYPDPMELVEKFGADSLRYYLLSSPAIRGEDLRFSMRGVEEISKKLIMRLDNVRSFYQLYAPQSTPSEKVLGSPRPDAARQARPDHFLQECSALHVLDQWILSRLGELLRETTAGYESYELDVATRPLARFIDDLSVWYTRRSRERLKGEDEDKQHALATLRYVLITTAKIMAPVMPFFAEDLYQHLKDEQDPESVHLSSWPEELPVDTTLLSRMQKVRDYATLALMRREKAGIKIRQPLQKLTLKEVADEEKLPAEFLEILTEEINVKEVVYAAVADVSGVELTTELTAELKEEGLLRDIIRAVQDLRKKEGLTIADRPTLYVGTSEEGEVFLEKYRDVLEEETNLFGVKITRSDEDLIGLASFPLKFRLEK